MWTEPPCEYCFSEIDTGTWGWGYLEDDYGQFAFHLECIQFAESVELS